MNTAQKQALDGRPVEPFTPQRPNFTARVTPSAAYDMAGVHRFELQPIPGMDVDGHRIGAQPMWRCWSLPDASFTVYVRVDGLVSTAGQFVGDLSALELLIGVLQEAHDAYPAATDSEDGATWPI